MKELTIGQNQDGRLEILSIGCNELNSDGCIDESWRSAENGGCELGITIGNEGRLLGLKFRDFGDGDPDWLAYHLGGDCRDNHRHSPEVMTLCPVRPLPAFHRILERQACRAISKYFAGSVSLLKSVVLLVISFTCCFVITSSTTGKEPPAGLVFRVERPIALEVAPNADMREFPRREKEEMGNEDYCPLCKVMINGIYRMESQKELVFPLDIAKPSTVRLRLYAFGEEPDKLTAGLYHENETRPIWKPAPHVLEPGASCDD